jgi:hypothetical protein
MVRPAVAVVIDSVGARVDDVVDPIAVVEMASSVTPSKITGETPTWRAVTTRSLST